MPENHDCGGDSAAYVLGALEPHEVVAFRRHLETCAICRDEVESMQELTDVLPMGTPQYPAPKQLRKRILDEVRADARSRQAQSHTRAAGIRRPLFAGVFAGVGGAGIRRPLLAAGAAAVIAVAAIAGVELGGSGGTHVYAASVGDAQLRVSSGHGELVVHHLPQPPGSNIYEVWLKRGNANPTPTKALFGVTKSGDADVDVPGNLHGVTSVLVTQEPAGGRSVPTTTPVVVASLA
jgi:Anti-sigma-K factor rskA/Putative zinc-finger